MSRSRPGWPLVKVAVRLALILMTCSLLPCTEVASEREARSVPLGLPLAFVVVDARRLSSAGYPQCVGFGAPRLDPMRLRPVPALANLGLLTLAVVLGAGALGRGWVATDGG